MFKNSHTYFKISSIFYFSYLDDSNKLAKGIGKFGRVGRFLKKKGTNTDFLSLVMSVFEP